MNLIGYFFIAMLLSFFGFAFGEPYNYVGLVLGITIFFLGLVHNAYSLKEEQVNKEYSKAPITKYRESENK